MPASISLTFTIGAASTGLPAGVTLQAIDGETMTSPTTMSNNYYASNGLTYVSTGRPAGFPNWDDPTFFPIDAFYALYDNTAADIPRFLDLGFSGSNGITGGSNFTEVFNNHIYVFGIWGDINNSTGNEPFGAWTTGFHKDEGDLTADIGNWPNSQSDGHPIDLVYTSNGFDSGFMINFVATMGGYLVKNFFNTPNGTKRSVDNFGTDFYWFAVSNDSAFAWGYSSRFTNAAAMTSADQMARGSHYGNMLDIERAWANGTNMASGRGAAGALGKSGAPSRIPLLPYIETATGRWTSMQRAITGPELVWATWSSIIHGARRLCYFTDNGLPNDFGGANGPTSQIYISTKSVIGFVKNMAAVINSPFALGYCSATPHGYTYPIYEGNWLNGGIETCVHWYQGGTYTPSFGPLAGVPITNGFYIFADTRYGESQGSVTATFTINHGHQPTSIAVLGENRSITTFTNLGGGSYSFQDTFANALTAHIYQVKG